MGANRITELKHIHYMNKVTLQTAKSQRKRYSKPQFIVVEINETELICTSTEALEEDAFDWEVT